MNEESSQNSMILKTGYPVLVLSFFLLSYILPLGCRDLIVPDETRYAEIPREMVATGDWTVPHLNGARYFEKPALGYWVHAGSLLLFGENKFAVRLPSALAVGWSALLLYLLVKRVSRQKAEEDGSTAILTALIFLSCLEVFAVGNTAVLDSLFSFFLTAANISFYVASEAPPGVAREKRFLALAGLACGLAFLTKGFLAFAVPVLSLAPYLVWQRRYSDLLRMSWLPVLVALLVALPWSLAIHLREPDFWHYFFWNEHVHRFFSGNAQHKESFWFFFLTAPGMFIPWTFLVPAAVPGIKARLLEQSQPGRLLRFCFCWLVLPFLLFSGSNGKLLTYVLPCFPPFAVLMAFGLLQTLKKKEQNKYVQGGIAGITLFLALILATFLYAQFCGFKGFRPFGQPWKAIMIINALVFFILLLFWAFRKQRRKDKVIIYGVAPLFLFVIIHFTLPDLTIEVKSPGTILEPHVKDIAADEVILSDENSIGAVCWYLQCDNVYLLERAGELEYGMGYQDARGRLLDIHTAVHLIHQNRGKTTLVARVKNMARWRDQLPKPVFQFQNGPAGYGIWKF